MKANEARKLPTKRASAKIYFFILAIVALLGTNVFYAIQYRNLDRQVEVLHGEKSHLQAEIDRIEAELNRVSPENSLILSPALLDERENVRARISDLRLRLNEREISPDEFLYARREVYRLRDLVATYSADVKKLKQQNEKLHSEKAALTKIVQNSKKTLTSLEGQNKKLSKENNDLSKRNDYLSEKVKTASILKISGININGIRERSRDRESTENRARRVDRLRIDFTIVDNPLAQKGRHEIYLRIIDPSGNLISNNSKIFTADRKRMQYTYHTTIHFVNDGKEYQIHWEPENDFRKGTYMVVLYADGYTMGRGSVSLK